jgi:hypothetical protein
MLNEHITSIISALGPEVHQAFQKDLARMVDRLSDEPFVVDKFTELLSEGMEPEEAKVAVGAWLALMVMDNEPPRASQRARRKARLRSARA